VAVCVPVRHCVPTMTVNDAQCYFSQVTQDMMLF